MLQQLSSCMGACVLIFIYNLSDTAHNNVEKIQMTNLIVFNITVKLIMWRFLMQHLFCHKMWQHAA